uniref:Uncharacterized protein n=1 Tax=Triticum urartu TaxID=4572 RepID=A0A8R7QS29_TRIUA
MELSQTRHIPSPFPLLESLHAFKACNLSHWTFYMVHSKFVWWLQNVIAHVLPLSLSISPSLVVTHTRPRTARPGEKTEQWCSVRIEDDTRLGFRNQCLLIFFSFN